MEREHSTAQGGGIFKSLHFTTSSRATVNHA